MAGTTDAKNGREGTLYYNLDSDADQLIATGWVRIGFAEDFNVDDNPNDIFYFDKWTLQTPKKGLAEITGSINQLYTRYVDTVLKLAKDKTPVALRLDMAVDGGGTVSERLYVKNAYWTNKSFKPGNLNDQQFMTVSANFRCEDYSFFNP